MTTRHTLGQRLAQARREKAVRDHRDITQADVADAVGYSRTAVSEWEADAKVPREDALAKLAAYLAVTPAFLRYGVREGQMAEPDPALDRRITASERAAAEALTKAQPPRKQEGDGGSHRRGAGGA